jgi:CPA1 family monovalent cation:H+ antiporter
MSDFYLSTFSCLALMSLSMGVYVLAKKIKIPFTVLLVMVGILLGLIVEFLPSLNFLLTFELTPEMLFYVFLPILLFESGYNMRAKHLLANKWSIGLLAIVSLVISALIIAGLLYIFGTILLGFPVPFIIYFLFGALISATDPVAVLALFKECGAPKRLTMIFEGESLFNDGTALAFFLVILGVVAHVGGYTGLHGNNLLDQLFAGAHSIGAITLKGILAFLSMLLLGGLFGALVGGVATKLVKRIKGAPLVEITISILLAHVTFLLAEGLSHYVLPLSGVIATTVAAVVFGSRGRKYLSPEIESSMHSLWDYMAFVSNAIIFLLL